MNLLTHEKIDRKLCGNPILLEAGRSRVELVTTQRMVADDSGLIHGGFIFGLADFAAMIAVNLPTVVLGAAEVKFLKPVKVGEKVFADAFVSEQKGNKHVVQVVVKRNAETIFEGKFISLVPEKHVFCEPF